MLGIVFGHLAGSMAGDAPSSKDATSPRRSYVRPCVGIVLLPGTANPFFTMWSRIAPLGEAELAQGFPLGTGQDRLGKIAPSLSGEQCVEQLH
jgi:hypothetical protein